MSAFLTILLPALVPALSDAVRAAVAKLSGGGVATPRTVAEHIQLMQAQTARLQALAELDKPGGTISQWVADLRASFRYLAVGAIELSAVLAVFAGYDGPGMAVLLDLAGAGMSFIIGERMYLALGRAAK